MSNPVLAKFFDQKSAVQPVPVQTNQYGNPNQAQAQYGPQANAQYGTQSAVITYDDVVTKTAICLGTVIGVGAITFAITPYPVVYTVAILFALVTAVSAFAISLKKFVTAPFAIGYAVAEGLFIGALSRMFEYVYPGIVAQAVFGTFVAAGAIFVAVKYLGLRPTARMRQVFAITAAAYGVAMLLQLLFMLGGINLGLVDYIGSVSWLGVLMCLLGTALAVFSLLQDFADVFDAVEYGADSAEAWNFAFGITVSMVWLYIKILRIIAYLRELAE